MQQKLRQLLHRFALHRLSIREALPMIGKTLGHYQLINELGKGGMGEGSPRVVLIIGILLHPYLPNSNRYSTNDITAPS